MKILLYQDQTLSLNLDSLSSGLAGASNHALKVSEGRAKFELSGRVISHPKTYHQMSADVLKEASTADLCLFFTRIPYENNYFYEGAENLVIVSFYAWAQLTPLPMENGVVFFVTKLVRYKLPLPPAHEFTSGCINDFLWDKTAIDLGMRSGLLCHTCRQHLKKQKFRPGTSKLLKATEKVLNDLSEASRNNESVIDYWSLGPTLGVSNITNHFDVFLCHNAKDKVEVRKVAKELEGRKVRPWLDEEQLRPGIAWQVLLEEQIKTIQSAAVFVGRSGIGPWQDIEMRAFLSEFASRRCPIIPVILAGAKTVPELPIFLRQLTWVDFREDPRSAINRLVWGITGRRPE